MYTALGNAARLREMLLQYEQNLGLSELNQFEKDVLFAFRLVQEKSGLDGPIASEEVKKYHSIRGMAHASYHRAVKGLTAKGFLTNETYGQYSICRRAPQAA
jgi:hypothetical protein